MVLLYHSTQLQENSKFLPEKIDFKVLKEIYNKYSKKSNPIIFDDYIKKFKQFYSIRTPSTYVEDSDIDDIQNYETNTTIYSSNHNKFPQEWNDSIKVFYNIPFITYVHIQYLEYECDTMRKYTSDNSNLSIVVLYKSADISLDNLNNIINMLITIYNWLNTDNIPIKLYILLTPFLKSFKYENYDYEWSKWTNKMPNDAIRPYNINSGLYYNDTIILFRYDEIYKIFIHECSHAFDTYHRNNNIALYFGNYPILLNEAITEYNAILLWIFLITKLHNKDYDFFKYLYYGELVNSMTMNRRFFKYYDIHDLNILRSPNNFQQYTNAFSYLFIKHLLLSNLGLDNKSVNKFLNEVDLNKYNYLLNDNIKCTDRLTLSAFFLSDSFTF